MKITSSFPGGNIVVERIEDDAIYLRPNLRDTEGDWFYWYFCAVGMEGRCIQFHFEGSRALAAHGPAISTDHGNSWRWLDSSAVTANSFTYSFRPEDKAVHFAMTIPYTATDWAQFIQAQGEKWLGMKNETLCQSRQNRPVESLLLGCRCAVPQHRVVLTARHHSCETMASYALEGLLSFVQSEDSLAATLQESVEFLVIPFMDKDGVENGDQGKNRRPHDHNRDYARESLYPETAALRRRLPEWSEGRLHVALDFHCPGIAGDYNEYLYIVGSSLPHIWTEQKRLASILEQTRTGLLPFHASNCLPYGEAWNTSANFRQGQCFIDWIAQRPEIQLAATLEIPYAVAHGQEVNTESARSFGADLGRALALYLSATH